MEPELLAALEKEKKMLEEQMLSLLKKNGSVQQALAYWKSLADVIKQVKTG